MFGTPTSGTPQDIGYLLLPRFSLMAFAGALEPLRMANTLAGKTLYRWRVFSLDGEPVTASNDMSMLADAPIGEVSRARPLLVCASYEPEKAVSRPLLAWLRRLDSIGVDLGALDTGSTVLARAGLLDGFRATIHWEHLESFAEDFPKVDVCQDIFIVDRTRFTCAGGTAPMDMMLYLIRQQHGHGFASAVAEEFVLNQIRPPSNPQRMALDLRLGTTDRRLVKAIQIMNQNLEEPLDLPALAHSAGISQRQLERLFQRFLGTTPARHYLGLRLEQARALLQQTRQPMIDIAVRCGFSSAAAFTRAYGRRFGHPPSADRVDMGPRP